MKPTTLYNTECLLGMNVIEHLIYEKFSTSLHSWFFSSNLVEVLTFIIY